MPALGARWPALPDDLLNVQYDVAACAIAAGWKGATIMESRSRLTRDGPLLRTIERAGGRPARVVQAVDGQRPDEYWQDAVVRASSADRP